MLKREFVKTYTERFGTEFVKEFTEKIKTPYLQYIRVNTLKIKVSDLIKRLENKGFKFEKVKEISYAFKILEEPFKITSTEEYLLGYFYIQDKSSMMPVIELNPKSNEVILDAASAPGGKTTHLAQLMNNKGAIISIDDSEKRLRALQFNVQRLGVKNTAVFQINLTNIQKLNISFDKILLDAPCSATGTVWKEKKRIKKVNKHEVVKHAKLQKELLKKLVKVLKKGGTIVYSTCSIEKEENDENVEYAEKELGLKVLKIKYLFPQVDDTIGFFYAVMKK